RWIFGEQTPRRMARSTGSMSGLSRRQNRATLGISAPARALIERTPPRGDLSGRAITRSP
ncbi:MAG TPA: hypothetical protein VFL62_11805, partial [Bradyrhizobium sp.]|uniref:hypothetical protein n=1 Tax=Bradyrhizobium sp. TaxID=376 RepID=UPI002D7EF331